MRTVILNLIGILFTAIVFGQNIESSTRIFIEESQHTRINKDWSIIAEFKSGIGEYVRFYPIEVIDLKSGEKTEALQLDMYTVKPKSKKTVWVGLNEVAEFIEFIEKHVIPNLDEKYKKKSSDFIFKAKEMTLTFSIYEKRKRLTIKLNNYDNSEFLNYTFWTETQVDKIPKLLEVLKAIK